LVVGRQSINTNNSLFDWISMDAMNSLNGSSLVPTGGGEEEAAALENLSTNTTNNTNLQHAVSNSTSGAPPTIVYNGIDAYNGTKESIDDNTKCIIIGVLDNFQILHGMNCCSEAVGCTNRPLFHIAKANNPQVPLCICLEHFLAIFGCSFDVVGDSLACVPVGSAYLGTIIQYCTKNSRSIIPHFLLFDASESVQKRPRALPSIPSCHIRNGVEFPVYDGSAVSNCEVNVIPFLLI